jgi:hypothetical protein
MGYIYRIVQSTSYNFESVTAALELRITNDITWNIARLTLQLEQNTLHVTSNAICITQNHCWHYSLKNARYKERYMENMKFLHFDIARCV